MLLDPPICYLSTLVDTYVAFRCFDTSVLFSPDLTEVCIILSSLVLSRTDSSCHILALLGIVNIVLFSPDLTELC
jgi:hypothetical protein